MIDATFIGYGLLALAGLVFTAIFAGVETGVYTLNRVRLAVRAGRGEPSAVILRREMQFPNRLLSTLLIGTNLASDAGSYAIAAILEHLKVGSGQAVLINAGLLVPMIFVFGEVLPKDLFRSHTDAWTYSCARLLQASRRLFTAVGLVPLVTASGRLSARLMRQAAPGAMPARERMAQLMLEGVGAGVISESQASLLDRALALRNLTVESEMTPWRRVTTVPADSKGAARTKRLANVRAGERIIVLDEQSWPIGAADPFALLLEPTNPARELMAGIVSVPPTTSVPRALHLTRSAGVKTAVVIDPRTRKPIGLVTVLDLVEPLTGGLVTNA